MVFSPAPSFSRPNVRRSGHLLRLSRASPFEEAHGMFCYANRAERGVERRIFFVRARGVYMIVGLPTPLCQVGRIQRKQTRRANKWTDMEPRCPRNTKPFFSSVHQLLRIFLQQASVRVPHQSQPGTPLCVGYCRRQACPKEPTLQEGNGLAPLLPSQ